MNELKPTVRKLMEIEVVGLFELATGLVENGIPEEEIAKALKEKCNKIHDLYTQLRHDEMQREARIAKENEER